MGGHARYSPSSGKRRLECPPSLLLEEQFPDEESLFAAEGTAGHAMAEYLINKYLKKRTKTVSVLQIWWWLIPIRSTLSICGGGRGVSSDLKCYRLWDENWFKPMRDDSRQWMRDDFLSVSFCFGWEGAVAYTADIKNVL